MDSNFVELSPSEAHPETMDFLSRAWCNFAVQSLQPDVQNKSIVLLDNSIKNLDCDLNDPFSKLDRKLDDGEFKYVPPWKSNDVQSWIWMQQAMHPELNYSCYFPKKWFTWKIVPFKTISLRKWLKEKKSKRKEEERLRRAEIHAALSVAGVAAALAAIAEENSKTSDESSSNKETAVASAAALVAAKCAEVAEAMGANRVQVSRVIGSAMTGTGASDILMLTAAAATSLRGAATLKQRTGCKKGQTGRELVLPTEENLDDSDLDYNKWRSILATGAELHVETPDGDFRVRLVSISLNGEAKVILQMKKLNLLKSKKESVVLDMHAELYKDSEADQGIDDTCYLIVLTTKHGSIKLDMGDDYHRYKSWATTIDHMLTISSSYPKHDFQFYKKN